MLIYRYITHNHYIHDGRSDGNNHRSTGHWYIATVGDSNYMPLENSNRPYYRNPI